MSYKPGTAGALRHAKFGDLAGGEAGNDDTHFLESSGNNNFRTWNKKDAVLGFVNSVNLQKLGFDENVFGNLGRGSFGRVMHVAATSRSLHQLQRLQDSVSYAIKGTSIPRSEKGFKVVIKFSGVPGTTSVNKMSKSLRAILQDMIAEYAYSGRREAKLLSYASRNFRKVLQCTVPNIPTLHFSGLLVKPVTSWLTVMSQAAGVTVYKYLQLKNNVLSAKEFASIEKAVLLLWGGSGVAHLDLHEQNCMYDAATNTATIIDLGQAVPLPNSLRDHARETVERVILRDKGQSRGAFDDLWFKDGLGAAAEAVALKAALLNKAVSDTMYNSDGHFLRRTLKFVPAAERVKIADARVRVWTCQMAPSNVLSLMGARWSRA